MSVCHNLSTATGEKKGMKVIPCHIQVNLYIYRQKSKFGGFGL